MKELIDAALDINNATLFNSLANSTVKNSSQALSDNNLANDEIAERLVRLSAELPELTNLTNVALDHARSLRYRVSYLVTPPTSHFKNDKQ